MLSFYIIGFEVTTILIIFFKWQRLNALNTALRTRIFFLMRIRNRPVKQVLIRSYTPNVLNHCLNVLHKHFPSIQCCRICQILLRIRQPNKTSKNSCYIMSKKACQFFYKKSRYTKMYKWSKTDIQYDPIWDKKKSFKLNVWPPKCIATQDKYCVF